MYQFIHPTKNGGTALDLLLLEHLSDTISPAMGHALRCEDVDHPITVIRHPVPRFISMYRYWKNGSERYIVDEESELKDITIKEFCKLIDNNSSKLFTRFTWEQHYLPQTWWLSPQCYKKTLVLVNEGSLHGCVNQLLLWLTIPPLQKPLANINISRSDDMEVVLDEEDIQWLHKKYETDFLLWEKLHQSPDDFGGIFFEEHSIVSGGYQRPIKKLYNGHIMNRLPDVLDFHPVHRRKSVCCKPDNATLKDIIFGVDTMGEDMSNFQDFVIPPEFPWSLDTAVLTEILSKYADQEFVSVIEVGTHMGTTAMRMANILKENPRSFVLCIDTWTSGSDDYLLRPESIKHNILPGNDCIHFSIFMANVIKHSLEKTIIPFRMPSVHAGRILFFHGIQVDVVYVDASHEYVDVKHDLEIYYRIVKNGGVIFGDDYQIRGVKRAVDEFFTELNLPIVFRKGVFFNNIQQIVWMVTKPQ